MMWLFPTAPHTHLTNNRTVALSRFLRSCGCTALQPHNMCLPRSVRSYFVFMQTNWTMFPSMCPEYQ